MDKDMESQSDRTAGLMRIHMDPVYWKEHSFVECISANTSFWSGIDVWIRTPHVLCKNIGAVSILDLGRHHSNSLDNCIEFFIRTLKDVDTKDYLAKLIKLYAEIKGGINPKDSNGVLLRIIFPKNGSFDKENIDMVIKDYHSGRVTFIKPVDQPSLVLPLTIPYSIISTEQKLRLMIPQDAVENEKLQWMRSKLLPKLVRWIAPQKNKAPVPSHHLISVEKYITVYNELKEKYFRSIKEIWQESTNPEKFIIEDIAIASYLLVLWGGKPQRFVDLGCGNGLLVHILNSEKHEGVGLDVRARKIWKMYPETTVLKETTLTPSVSCTFPNVDWVIGNHSDELTPWIPVIASNSGHQTNFFLLPCCLFDFSGKKYARRDSGLSCYEEYMLYLKEICYIAGFDVELDRLKIPSTKRICLVGRERYYRESAREIIEQCLNRFVQTRMGDEEVAVRSTQERVRNCTKLNKDFLEDIVMKLGNIIISSAPYNEWREGEFTDLEIMAKALTPEERKCLKKECGGLQTLLKNHRHIFLVEKGQVKLRRPTVRSVAPQSQKKKECWFFKHHPDSCPLSNEECTYIHNTEAVLQV